MSEIAVKPVAGARWSVAAAGIKSTKDDGSNPLDIALLELEAGSRVAAVFTQNAFCAAPVIVSQTHLVAIADSAKSEAIYCLINSGNANAGTGEGGMHAAQQSCQSLASQFDIGRSSVLPFSTGVIGEPLPIDKIECVQGKLQAGLAEENWNVASEAIMTTDTVPKAASRTVQIGDNQLTISGIAKGAGMIKPNMATMLAFVVTDAAIAQADLQALVTKSADISFNRITVDGDTSTNDACLLAATGKSGVQLMPGGQGWTEFEAEVISLMQELAAAIIRDAEGATKFITLDVVNAATTDECLQVAYTVAESPLVKTAFFASDANWGRILAAVGRSGVQNLNVNDVTIALGDYLICAQGGRVADYDEQRATQIMSQPEVTITISLARGEACERVWTSDLSHDYVRINAEYRT